MAVPFSTLITHAIQNRSTELNDAFAKSNAIMTVLKEKGGIKPFDGGTSITENIMYGSGNGGYQVYSGFDTLTTNVSEMATMLELPIAQYASSVAISGLEKAQNSGKSKMIDLITSRTTGAEKELINGLTAGLYGDGSVSGSLTGLQAALTATPALGTYGGVSRVDNTWFRHRATTGTALTAANIFGIFQTMQLQLTRGTDAPSLILCPLNHFQLLSSAMIANQRYESVANGKYTNMGFQNLMFNGIPVFVETAYLGTSMPADVSYFLNMDTVKLRPFRTNSFQKFEANLASKDADAFIMKWYGNLVISNPALNGIVKG